MIIKQMPVGQMAVFCYIVGCAETLEGVLIDPAGSEEQILKVLARKKLNARYILNTHGHPDHTCGNQLIQERTGAKIVMHEADARLFDTPAARVMARQMGFRPSPPVDWQVRDGDLISFGRETLQVIHTPGHTPGGICLYGRGNLFTGDTLFVGAAGRTGPAGGLPRNITPIVSGEDHDFTGRHRDPARPRLWRSAHLNGGAGEEDQSVLHRFLSGEERTNRRTPNIQH